MTRLSPAQVATVAARGGFRGVGLERAVAVALAESGGRTDAVGLNHDRWHSRDRGLWQINDHWHPEVSDAQAFSPESAAAAAFRISRQGTDWGAWSTWHNGAALAQMGRARMAIAQAKTAGTKSAGSSVKPGQATPAWWLMDTPFGVPLPVPGGPSDLGHALHVPNPLAAAATGLGLMVKAGAWMADSHNWGRVAMVAGGTVGILLALKLIAESGAAGSTAGQVAAIPGKAAKAAVGTAAKLAVVA